MKRYNRIPAVLVLVLVLAMLSACGSPQFQVSTTPPVAGQTDSQVVQTTPRGILAQQQALHAQQAASTQPGATVKAPDPEQVKNVDIIAEAVKKLPATVTPDQTVYVFVPAPQLPSVVGTVVPLLSQATPLLGGWGDVASGVLATLGAAWGVYQSIQKKKSDKAMKSVNTGLQSAINQGAITVSAAAPAIVNASVVDHPATSQTVDMLSVASKTPLIQ